MMSTEEEHGQELTEADTCRNYVTPALQRAGWAVQPHSIGEQHFITAGRIHLIGGKPRRGKGRKADYLLYYRRDFPIAVVEAKKKGLPARIVGSSATTRPLRSPDDNDRLGKR